MNTYNVHTFHIQDSVECKADAIRTVTCLNLLSVDLANNDCLRLDAVGC